MSDSTGPGSSQLKPQSAFEHRLKGQLPGTADIRSCIFECKMSPVPPHSGQEGRETVRISMVSTLLFFTACLQAIF
jgi:hypothetical protein